MSNPDHGRMGDFAASHCPTFVDRMWSNFVYGDRAQSLVLDLCSLEDSPCMASIVLTFWRPLPLQGMDGAMKPSAHLEIRRVHVWECARRSLPSKLRPATVLLGVRDRVLRCCAENFLIAKVLGSTYPISSSRQ